MGTEQGVVLTCNMRKKAPAAQPTVAAAGSAAHGAAVSTTSAHPAPAAASAASATGAAAAAAQPSGTVASQDGGTGVGRHHGPIYAIQRNPVHPTFFMTVGDWSARVWCEKNKGPIMVMPYAKAYVTTGG